MTAAREKPILFSGPMVRAILEGRKTQTRRAVKPQPTHIEWFEHQRGWIGSFGDDAGSATNPHRMVSSPYEVGMKMWVRETWQQDPAGDHAICYRATGHDEMCVIADHLWRPSIFMPRWASRITLEITGVRVERLQEISEDDAKAEGTAGVAGCGCGRNELKIAWCRQCGQGCFWSLWDSINAKKHPWASNPWVWVIAFRRVD